MAKDNSTKVKDYRYKLPGLTLDDAKRKVVAVYLNTDSGIFTMRLPEEVVGILGGTGIVSDRDMNTCIREFDRLIDKYENTIRTQSAKPVIVIWWVYNKPKPKDAPFNTAVTYQIGGSFSSDRAPDLAMGLEYEVLYQIGNGLYELAVDERNGDVYGKPHHRMSLPAKGRKVMDWTQEREAFIANMVKSMQGLIERVNHFFAADFIANIDLAIESGASALALPAPPKGDDS